MGRLFANRRRLSLAEAAADPKVRQTLERVLTASPYRGAVPRAFAAGGQGVLFRLELKGGGARILKLPSYGTCPESEHWLLERSLAKECALLARVRSRHLPGLREHDPAGTYLFREFVAGRTLAEALLEPGLSATGRAELAFRTLRMAQDLFRACHQLPDDPLVLRDLKPVNIVLCEDQPRAVLVDIGSARSESAMLTRTARPHRLGSGKWLYWAPEQLLSAQTGLDRRADYFSLGATVFAILTGQPPYRNNEPDPDKALRAYRARFPSVSRQLRAAGRACSIAPEIVDFLINCLHPLSSRRFAVWPELPRHIPAKIPKRKTRGNQRDWD